MDKEYKSLRHFIDTDHRVLVYKENQRIYMITDFDREHADATKDHEYPRGASLRLITPFINVQTRFGFGYWDKEWRVPTPEEMEEVGKMFIKVFELIEHMERHIKFTNGILHGAIKE